MLTTRILHQDLKNIIEFIVELCFILDIDISIDSSFKELLFRRAEYVWLWKFLLKFGWQFSHNVLFCFICKFNLLLPTILINL